MRFLPCAFPALAVLLLAACGAPTERPAPAADAPDSGEPVSVAAVYAGEPITVAELDEWVRDDLFRRETRDGNEGKLYEVRRVALDNLLRQRILADAAAEAGVSERELVDRRMAAMGAVSDEEVTAFYEDNRSRLRGQTLEALEPRIRAFLEQQREDRAIAAIEAEADVAIHLERPRYEVAAEGPALGPEGAPVTIVEFSDFECPFCSRASGVVKQLRERYPEQVRIVYKQFPLDIHPRARLAAEASLCADDQGQFWPYHDVLFANAKQLGRPDLVRYATDLGLDVASFEQCLTDGTHREQVETDVDQGVDLGVTGTPAFFVNGIMLTGARPLDDFVEIIDEELERTAPESS